MLEVTARLPPKRPHAQHEAPSLPTSPVRTESAQRRVCGKMPMEGEATRVSLQGEVLRITPYMGTATRIPHQGEVSGLAPHRGETSQVDDTT